MPPSAVMSRAANPATPAPAAAGHQRRIPVTVRTWTVVAMTLTPSARNLVPTSLLRPAAGPHPRAVTGHPCRSHGSAACADRVVLGSDGEGPVVDHALHHDGGRDPPDPGERGELLV